MNWLIKLLAFFSQAPPLPETRTPPPPGIDRLHLFAGEFGSEAAAMSYVFDAPDSNHPEPFTNDLPDAFVDTQYVDVAHGAQMVPTFETIADTQRHSYVLGRADTLLIVNERAFGGFPFSLQDTPRAQYLGMWEVAQ